MRDNRDDLSVRRGNPTPFAWTIGASFRSSSGAARPSVRRLCMSWMGTLALYPLLLCVAKEFPLRCSRRTCARFFLCSWRLRPYLIALSEVPEAPGAAHAIGAFVEVIPPRPLRPRERTLTSLRLRRCLSAALARSPRHFSRSHVLFAPGRNRGRRGRRRGRLGLTFAGAQHGAVWTVGIEEVTPAPGRARIGIVFAAAGDARLSREEGENERRNEKCFFESHARESITRAEGGKLRLGRSKASCFPRRRLCRCSRLLR